MGNQSLSSLALISARHTKTTNDVLAQIVAVHLIAVCQALDIRATNIECLDSYEAQFEQLVMLHYASIEQQHRDDEPVGLASTVNIITSDVKTSLERVVLLEEPSGGSRLVTSASFERLGKSLWRLLIVSLDATASMDASDRFGAVAKSLRAAVLDDTAFNRDPDLVGRLQRFTAALDLSIEQ